jgi:hypothetical protein
MDRQDLKKLALMGIALVASQGAIAGETLSQTNSVFLAHSCGAGSCGGKRAPTKTNGNVAMSDDEMMMQQQGQMQPGMQQGQMQGQPVQQGQRQGGCASKSNGNGGSCATRSNGNGGNGGSCATKNAPKSY